MINSFQELSEFNLQTIKEIRKNRREWVLKSIITFDKANWLNSLSFLLLHGILTEEQFRQATKLYSNNI